MGELKESSDIPENSILAKVTNQLLSLQDEKGMLKGIESTLVGYVEELRQDESCCPLCHRSFEEALESQDLTVKLEERLQVLLLLIAEKKAEVEELLQLFLQSATWLDRDQGTLINSEPDDFSASLYPLDQSDLQNEGSKSPQLSVSSVEDQTDASLDLTNMSKSLDQTNVSVTLDPTDVAEEQSEDSSTLKTLQSDSRGGPGQLLTGENSQVSQPTAEVLPHGKGLRILEPEGNPTFKCFVCDGHYLNKEFFDKHLLEHEQQSLKQVYLNSKRLNEATLENPPSACQKTVIKITKCKQNSEVDQNSHKQSKELMVSPGHHKSSSDVSLCKEVILGSESGTLKLVNLETYTCTKCEKSFSQKDQVIRHYKAIHLTPTHFTCNICNQGFSEERYLQIHMNKEHKTKCYICNRVFRKDRFQQHMKRHNREIKCNVCNRVFNNKYRFQQHIKMHNSMEKSFLCDECGLTFRSKTCLDLHSNTHLIQGVSKEGHIQNHTKNNLERKCDVCYRVFNRKDRFQRHMERHNSEQKSYLCEECGLTFSKKKLLILHLKTHPKEEKFICVQCGKQFRLNCYLKQHARTHFKQHERPHLKQHARTHSKQHERTHLKQHERTHLKQQERTHLKQQERTHLKQHEGTHLKQHERTHLKQHERTHLKRECIPKAVNTQKKFKCPICCKSFRSRYVLTHHKFTHTGEKPFSCDVCSKSYHRPDSLKYHVLLHKSKFICDLCGKGFTKKITLKHHMIRHDKSKRRQFVCKTCDKGFPLASSLKRHELLHNEGNEKEVGLKKFECDDCGRLFTYKHHMKHHREVVHQGIKRHKCSSCSRVFSTYGSLIMHELIHNPLVKHLTCGICMQTCKSRYLLAKHLLNHSNSEDATQT